MRIKYKLSMKGRWKKKLTEGANDLQDMGMGREKCKRKSLLHVEPLDLQILPKIERLSQYPYPELSNFQLIMSNSALVCHDFVTGPAPTPPFCDWWASLISDCLSWVLGVQNLRIPVTRFKIQITARWVQSTTHLIKNSHTMV